MSDLLSLFKATNEGFEQTKPKKGVSNSIGILRPGIKIVKIPENVKQQFRFITIPGVGSWAMPLSVHKELGGKFNNVLCPRQIGQKCQSCELNEDFYSKGQKELAKPFWASTQYLTYIVDRQHPELGVQNWILSGGESMQTIVGMVTDPETGNALINIGDPKQGRDLYFSKKKNAGGFAKFGEFFIQQTDTPLHSDNATMEKWLTYVMENLPQTILNYVDSKKIEELINNGSSEDESEAVSTVYTPSTQTINGSAVAHLPVQSSIPVTLPTGETPLSSETTQQAAVIGALNQPTPPANVPNNDDMLAKIAAIKATMAVSNK